MRKNNDNSSQIYLLSLDTFMIMTVMGITLGIIFFILNPTLNSGISLNTSKTEIYLNEKDIIYTKNILKKYDCDIGETPFCEIRAGKDAYLDIYFDGNTISFTLRDNLDKEIEKNSVREEAIKKIGLSKILP
jgi:hypothetical protein